MHHGRQRQQRLSITLEALSDRLSLPAFSALSPLPALLFEPYVQRFLAWGLSRNGVKNYSIGSVCDLPGVTPGTASAAMKRPFFGAWASGTTATVMAKRYRLWPCRNRPREGPENLAKIETLAMGFLATPKARSARSLASASTPAFRHRISTRSGCSCGSCESSWNAVAGRRSSSLLKRSSPDPGGARRETICPTLRGGAR